MTQSAEPGFGPWQPSSLNYHTSAACLLRAHFNEHWQRASPHHCPSPFESQKVWFRDSSHLSGLGAGVQGGGMVRELKVKNDDVDDLDSEFRILRIGSNVNGLLMEWLYDLFLKLYKYRSQPVSVKAEVGDAHPPPTPCWVWRASRSTDLWHHPE